MHDMNTIKAFIKDDEAANQNLSRLTNVPNPNFSVGWDEVVGNAIENFKIVGWVWVLITVWRIQK